MKCIKCGKQINKKLNKCPFCGALLREEKKDITKEEKIAKGVFGAETAAIAGAMFASKTKAEIEENQKKSFEGNVVVNKENAANKESVNNSNTNNSSVNSSSDLSTTTSSSNLNDPFSFSASAPIYQSSPDNSSTYDATYNTSNDDNYRIVNDFLNENVNKEIEKFDLDSLTIEQKQEVTQNVYNSIRDYIKELIDSGEIEVEGDLTDEELNKLIAQFLSGDNSNQDNGDLVVLDRSKIEEEFTRIINENLEEYGIKIDFKLSENVLNLEDIEIIEKDGNRTYKDKEGNIYNSLEELVVAHPELIDVLKVIEENSEDEEKNDLEDENAGGGYAGGVVSIDYAALGSAIAILGGPSITGQDNAKNKGKTGWNYLQNKASDLNKVFEKFQTGENKTSQHGATYNFSISGTKYASSFSSMCSSISKIGVKGSGSGYNSFLANLHKQLVNLKEKMDDSNKDKDGKEIFSDSEKTLMNYAFDLTASEYAAGYGAMLGQSEAVIANWMDTFNTSAQKRKDDFYKELDKTNRKTFDSNYKNIIDAMLEQEYAAKWAEKHGNEYPSEKDRKSSKYKEGLASYKEKNKQAYSKGSEKYKEYKKKFLESQSSYYKSLEENNIRLKDYHAQSAVIENLAKEYENSQKLLSLEEEIKELDRLLAERKITKKEYLSAKLEIESEMKKYDDHFDAIRALGSTNEERALYEKYYNEVMNENASSIEVLAILDDYDKLLANYSDLDEKTKSVLDKATELKNSQARLAELNGLEHLTEKQEEEKKELEKITGQYSGVASALYYYQNATRVFNEYAENLREHGFAVEDNELQIILLTQKLDNMAQANNEAAILVKKINDNLATEEDKKRLEQIGKDYGVLTKEVDGVLTIYRNNDPTNGTLFGLTEEESALYFSDYANEVLPKIKVQSMVNNISEWAIKDRKGELSGKELEYFHQAQEILKARSTLEKYADLETIPPYLEEEINKARELVYNFSVADQIAFQHMESARLNLDFYSNIGEYFKAQDDVRAFNIAKQMFENNQELCQIEMGSNDNSAHYQARKDELHTTAVVSEQDKQWLEENYGDSIKLWNLINNFDELKGEYDSKLVAEAKKVLDAKAQLERYDELYGRRTKLTAEEKEEYNALKTQLSTIKSNANPFSDVELAIFGYSDTARAYDEIRTNYLSSGYAVENKDLDIIKLVDDMNSQSTAYYRKVFLERELQNNTSLTASERQKYETELEGLKDAKPVALTKEQSDLYMGRYANEILPAVKVQTAVYNYEEWQEKYNNGKLTKAEEEIYLQATEIVDARRYLELKDKEKLTTDEKNELSRLESKIDTDTVTSKAYPFSQVEQLAFSNMENARIFMEFGNNLNRYGYSVENKDLDIVLLTDSMCNQAITYYNAQEEIKEITDKLANSHLSDRDRTNYERRLTELYKIEKPRLTEEQTKVYNEQYTKILPAIKTQSILYNYEEWQEKYNNNELTDAETKEFLRAKVIIDSRKEYNRFLELQDFKNQRELTPEELQEYNRINSHMDIIESNINPFSQVEQIAFSNMENSRLYSEFGNNLAKYGYAVSNKDIQIVLLTNKLYTMSENNLEISNIMSRIALGQATEEDVKKLEEYNKIKQDGLTEEESKLYFSEYAQKVLPKIKTQEIINNYSEWQEKYANGTLSKEEQELYSQATQIISAKGQYKRYLELKDKTTLSTSETKELEKLESKIDSIYSNANKFSVVDQLAYYNISNANMYMASSREMQTVLRIISGTNFETQVLSSNNDDITIYTPVISEENQEYIDNYYKNSHALQVQNAILHLDELDPNSALYKEAQEAQEAQSKIEKYQTLKGIEASEQELSSEQKRELASIEKDLKTIVDNACFLSSSEQLIFSYMRSIELNNEYLSVSKELEEAKQIQTLRDETTLNVYATRKQTAEFFENHPEAVEIDDKVATLEEQLKDIEYNRNVSRLDMIRINEMSSGNLDGFISSNDIHNYLLANNAEYNQLSFDVDNYILEKTKEQQSENLSAINKATSDSNWFKVLSVIGNAFNAQYHDPAGEALSKLILKDKYIEPERMGADGLTDSQREIFENKYGLVIEYGLENAILNQKIEQTAADQIKCILNAQDKSLFSNDLGVDHYVKIPDPETSTFQMYFYDKDGKLVKNKDQIALYCISNGIDATGLDVSGNIKKYTDNLNALVAGSKENNYNYTTEQALQCYSYLMNKYGIDEATEIFSIFNDTGAKIIGYELGQERYAKMKEAFENTSGFWSDAGKFAYMAGYSLYDGVNGWADNFINIFAADGRKTAKDYKIEKFLNDVTLDDDFASYLINEYEIGSSIGNMLPSIVATLGISVATGGLGLPETALKSFQFLASFATMGLSAAGGTKQQAMIDGMDEATATIYGLLSGLSETTMEAVLGKLPGLSMLNESFEGAKGIAGVFTKMLSEGFEESVQEVYDAFLSSVFTGESVVVDPNAVLKAGLYGAITSGVMSGAGGVASQGLNIVNVGIDLASYAVLDSPSALNYINNKYSGKSIIELFTSQELRSDLRFMNQIRNNLKEKIAVAEVDPELKAKYDQLVANGEINSEKIKYSDYALEEAYAALNLEQAIINARNESLNYGHDSIASLTDDRIANILTERQETLDSLREKREQYIKLQRDLGLTNDQVSELLNNNKEGILNIAAESKLINLHAEISELLSELNKSNDYVYDNYLSIRDTLLNLESSIENDSSLATRENTDTVSKLKHQLELFENITSINDDILLKSTTEQEINDTLLYNEKLLAERLLTLQKINEKLDENNQIIQDINPEEKNNTEFDKLNKDIESLEVLKEKLDREIEVLGKRLETTLDSRDTIATLLSEDNSRINTILEDYRTQLESIEQKNVELRERLKKENDFTILSNIEKEIQSNDTEIEKLEKQVSNLQENIDKNNTEIEKLTNGKIIGINNGSDTQTSQVLRAISGDTVLMGLIPNNLRQMLGVVDNTPENNNAPGNTNAPVIDGRSDRSTMDDRAASDIKFNDEVIHDEQSSQDEVPVLKPDISLDENGIPRTIDNDSVKKYFEIESAEKSIEFLKRDDVKQVVINGYSDEDFNEFIRTDYNGDKIRALFDLNGLDMLSKSEHIQKRMDIIFDSQIVKDILFKEEEFCDFMIKNVNKISETFGKIKVETDKAFLDYLGENKSKYSTQMADVLSNLNKDEVNYLNDMYDIVNDVVSEIIHGMLDSLDKEDEDSLNIETNIKSIDSLLSLGTLDERKLNTVLSMLNTVNNTINQSEMDESKIKIASNAVTELMNKYQDTFDSDIKLKEQQFVNELGENKAKNTLNELEREEESIDYSKLTTSEISDVVLILDNDNLDASVVNRMLENIELTDEVLDRCGITLLTNIHKLSNESVKNRVLEYYQSESIDTSTLSDEAIYEIIENPVFIDLFSKTSFIDEVISRDLNVNRIISSMPKESLQRIIYSVNDMQTYADFVNKISDIEVVRNILSSGFKNTENIIDHLNEKMLDEVISNNLLSKENIEDLIVRIIDKKSNIDVNKLFNDLTVEQVKEYELFFRTGLTEYGRKNLIPLLNANNILKIKEFYGNVIYSRLTYQQLVELESIGNSEFIDYLTNLQKAIYIINSKYDSYIEHVSNPRNLIGVYYTVNRADGSKCKIGLSNIINNNGKPIYVYNINGSMYYSTTNIASITANSRDFLYNEVADEFLSESRLDSILASDRFLGKIEVKDGKFTINMDEKSEVLSIVDTYVNEDTNFYEHLRDSNTRKQFGTNQRVREVNRTRNFVTEDGVDSGIDIGSYNRLIEYFKNKYNLSEKITSRILLDVIDNEAGACSYADLTNVIFSTFKNNASAFKKTFGFDMYEFENGKKTLNYRMLLMDMYVRMNSTDLSVYDGAHHPRIFSIDSETNERIINARVDENGKIKVDRFGDIEYCTDKEQVYASRGGILTHAAIKYLNDYGIEIENNTSLNYFDKDGSLDIDRLKQDLRRRILNGEHLSLTERIKTINTKDKNGKTIRVVDQSQKNLIFHNLDGERNTEILNWKEGAGHVTTIVGLTEDGVIVVSWGMKHEIKFSDLTQYNCRFTTTNLNTPLLRTTAENSVRYQELSNMDIVTLSNEIRTDDSIDLDYILKNYLSHETISGLIDEMGANEVLSRVRSARSVNTILEIIRNQISKEEFLQTLSNLTTEQKLLLIRNDDINNELKLDVVNSATTGNDLAYAMIELYDAFSSDDFNNFRQNLTTSQMRLLVESDILGEREKIGYVRNAHMDPESVSKYFVDDITRLLSYANEYYDSKIEYSKFLNKLSFDQLVDSVLFYSATNEHLDALINKSEDSSYLTNLLFNKISRNDIYDYIISKNYAELGNISNKLTEEGKIKLSNVIKNGFDSLFDEEATLERTVEPNKENIENKINDESIIVNSSEVIDEGSMIREYSEVNKSTLKERILAKINPEMSEFEKARLIYLELGKKLDYSALYRYSLSTEGSAYYESEYNRKLTMDEAEKTGCICATWAQIYSEMLIAAGFKPESIVVQRLMYDENSYVNNSHAAMYVILEDGSLIVPDMTIPLGHPDYYNIKVGRPTTGFMYLSSEQIKSKYWHDSEFANVTKESRISEFNYRLEFMDGVNDNLSEEVRDIIDEFGSYFYGWVLRNPKGNIKYNIDKAKLAKQKAIFKIINEGTTEAVLKVDSRISPLLSVSDYFIEELTEELIERRTKNDLELFDSLSLLGNIKLEDIKKIRLPDLLEALPTLFGIDNVRDRNIGTLQQYMRDVASQENLLTGGRNNKTITIGLNNKTQNNALNININETDENGKSVIVTSFGIRVDENNKYVIYSNTIATKINKLLESSDRTEVTQILESLTPSELLTLENIGVNVSEYIDMNTQKIIEAQNLVEIGATESIATRVSNIVTDIEKQVDSNQILDSQKIKLTKALINLRNSINNKLSTITNSISKIYSRIVNSINNLIPKLDSKPISTSDNIIDNILNGRKIDESVKERLLTTREFNRLILDYDPDSNKLEFEERLNSIIQNVKIELDIQNKLNSGIDFDNTIERLSTLPGESIVRILNSLDKELFTKCITSMDSDILSNIRFNYELINKIPKEVFKTLYESNTFIKNNIGSIALSYSKFDLTADEVASRILQINNYSLFIDEGYIDLISEIKDIKLIRELLDADGNYKKVYFILDYTSDEIFNELIKDKEFVNEHKYDLIDLTRENLDSDTILSNMEIDGYLANTISDFPNFVNNIKSMDNIKKLINSYSNNEYKIRFLDKVNTNLNNGLISNYVVDFLNSLSTDEFNELYEKIDVDLVSLIIKTGIREYNNQILNKVFMSNNINSLTSSDILYLYQTNNDYIKYIDGNNLIDLYLSTNDPKILDYIKENPKLLHVNITVGDSELIYLGVLTIDGRKVYEYKYNNKVLYTDSELFTLCLSEGAKVIDLIKEELITKDTSFVGRITSDLRYEFDSEMSDLIESRINTGLTEKEAFFEKHRHGNKRSTLGTNQKIKRSERIYSFIRRNNYGQIGPSQINTPSFRRFVDHFSSKYNMTESLIIETINNIIDSQKGACSYANLCNVILWIFRNNPEGFKRRFGFDMYEYENGVRVLNTRALLFDMYLFFNSSDTNPNGRIFTIDTDGKRKLNIINEDGKFRTANSKEQVYACNIDGYYQIAFDYLRHYGIETEGSKLTLSYNEDGSVDIDVLKNEIKRRLANGEILSLTERVEMDTDEKENKVVSKDAHELILYNLDETNDYSSTFNWNEGGAHITTIIGANEDGLIVITWGHKALIRYSDLYSDNSAILSLNLEMNSEENIQVTRNKIKELIAKKDYLQVIRGLESNIINLDTLELTDNKELLIELLNNMEPNSILKYTSDPKILLEYYNLIVDNPEIVNEFINSMSLEQKINLYYNSYNEIKLKELIIRSLTKEELESISDNDYTFIKSIEVYLTEKQKSYIKEQTEISSKQSLMEKLLGVKKNDEVLHYYTESDIIEANNSSSEHNQSAIIEIDDSEDVGAVNSSPHKLDGLQKSSIVDYFSKASSNLKTRIIKSSNIIVNGFPENMIVETNGIRIEMSGHKEGDRIIGCLKHANEIVESVLTNYSVSINKADLDELLNIAKQKGFKGTFKLAPNGDYLIEVNGGYGTNNQLYTDLKNFLGNNEKAKSIIAKIDSSKAESIGQSNYCANKDSLTGKYRLESLLISAGIIDENGNLTQNYQNETEIIDILQKIKKNKGIIDSSDLNKIRNIARLATMHLYMNAIDKCINQQNNSEKYKYSSSKYSRGLKILVDANANNNAKEKEKNSFIIEILGNDISPTRKKIFHMYPTSERVNSNALAPIISSIEWYIKEISKRISNDEAIKPSNSKEYKMIVKQELINTMILDSTDTGYTSTFFHITISNMIEELFNFDRGKNLGLNKYLDEMYENPELKINLMQMHERMKDSVYAKVDENNLTLISKVYESIITIIINDKVFNVFSTDEDEDIKKYILSGLPNSQLAEKAFDELMKNIDFQNMLKNGKINTCTEEELKDLIGWWSYE